MGMRSALESGVRQTGARSKYDAACKLLLSEKVVLARILSACVDECAGMPIEQIRQLISDEVGAGASRLPTSGRRGLAGCGSMNSLPRLTRDMAPLEYAACATRTLALRRA